MAREKPMFAQFIRLRKRKCEVLRAYRSDKCTGLPTGDHCGAHFVTFELRRPKLPSARDPAAKWKASHDTATVGSTRLAAARRIASHQAAINDRRRRGRGP